VVGLVVASTPALPVALADFQALVYTVMPPASTVAPSGTLIFTILQLVSTIAATIPARVISSVFFMLVIGFRC